MSRVACRVSRVACRVSRVACRVSRVACRVSRVACRVSIVTCRLSIVDCRVSRVACRVSRVACRVSRVACRVSRVACRVSRVACRVSRTLRTAPYLALPLGAVTLEVPRRVCRVAADDNLSLLLAHPRVLGPRDVRTPDGWGQMEAGQCQWIATLRPTTNCGNFIITRYIE